MKAFVPIAASVALALAPVAHAQVTCSEIATINDSGIEEDFDDIADEEIGDDLYDASYYISGAGECSVDYQGESIYSCEWTYASYDAALSAYNAQVSALGSCLSGWQYRAGSPDAAANADGYRATQVIFYEGAGRYIDLEWGAFLEEHTQSSGVDWHVVVGVAHFW